MSLVYKLSGKLYDFLDNTFEQKRYTKIRTAMLKNLRGTILDAGCGTGRNFPYYSEKATVIGVDNSLPMLSQAQQRLRKNIKIERMNLTRLEFEDNTFDAIVATFVLCVMPEKIQRKALKELIRVAKPEAQLYFLEYVYSQKLFKIIKL